MATATMSQAATRTIGGDRFVGSALLVLAGIFAVLQLLAGEMLVFFVLPMVLYAALGVALLWRRRRWLLVVAIVLLLAHIGSSLPFMLPGFTHPESPASFLPDVFIVLTSLTGIAGAAMALPRSGARNRRPIAMVAVALAGVALAGSLVAAVGVSSDARQAGDVAITAADVDYPSSVTAAPGTALWIDNADPFRHTFVIVGTDVRAELPGSSSVRIEEDLAPGTYTFFCDVPGHEDAMRGKLTIG